MRSLWHSTVSVLRQHPILWLPVAIVEFIDFNLRWLNNLLHHYLIQHIFLRQSEDSSVLSATAIAHLHASIHRSEYLTVPLDWCVLLLYNLLLTCTMVATAAMLQRIAQTGIGTLRDAVPPILSSARRMMVFALTLFGLNVIGHSLAGILSSLMQPLNLIDFQTKLEKILSLSLKSSVALEKSNLFNNLFNNLWPIPITLCVVYIIAPLQVRLLQPPNTNPTTQQTRQARIAWSLAIVTSAIAICTMLLLQVTLSFVPQASPGIVYIFQAVTYLISIALYAPLFIAIYLIATSESPLLISSTLPDAGPEEDVPPTEDAP